VLLPCELYDLIWQRVQKRVMEIHYSKVIMPLSALLEGEFFNAYIKSGTTVTSFCFSSLTNVVRVNSNVIRRKAWSRQFIFPK
jgi:ribonuclease P/MRP protein subunit RPP40